jgi:molecular chaperone GrpE
MHPEHPESVPGDASGAPAEAIPPGTAESEAPAAGEGAGAPVDLEGRLAEAEARAAEHFEAFARARAEMENIRKRAQEDVAKAHKYGIESFAESLLPVKDSLEMALKVEAPTVESIREGVEATLKLIGSVFERNKLIELDPVGQKFDPNQHQAISMVPAASLNPPVPANHVVNVLQRGYLINDRVLRPALVIVSQG